MSTPKSSRWSFFKKWVNIPQDPIPDIQPEPIRCIAQTIINDLDISKLNDWIFEAETWFIERITNKCKNYIIIKHSDVYAGKKKKILKYKE